MSIFTTGPKKNKTKIIKIKPILKSQSSPKNLIKKKDMNGFMFYEKLKKIYDDTKEYSDRLIKNINDMGPKEWSPFIIFKYNNIIKLLL